MYYDKFLASFFEKHTIELTTEIREGLDGYDPRKLYSMSEGNFNPMTDTRHKIEVGRIANLITRMSEEKAPRKEMVKAIRHLLVVIDAQKYFLDYKKSEQDHDILELRKKYPYKVNVH